MRKIEGLVPGEEDKGKEKLPDGHPRVRIIDIGSTTREDLSDVLFRNFRIDTGRDPYEALRELVTKGVVSGDHEDDLRDLGEKLGNFIFVREAREPLANAVRDFEAFRAGSLIEFSDFKFPGVPRWMFTLPEPYFRELTLSRSVGMFERESFERFRKTKFLILGMGVGTAIMHALVQHGAEDVTCFDGGTVSLHDLNRQNMGVLGKGMNHARYAVEQALLFNPWGHYVAQERNVLLDPRGQFVDLEDLGRAQLIIEEVDALWIKHAIRVGVNKPIMMFTDLGFASARRFDLGSNPNHFGLEESEILELQGAHVSGYKEMTRERMTYFASRMIGSLSDSFVEAQMRVAKHGGDFWHQPKASADRTANLVMRTMVDYFDGMEIPPYVLDETK